MIESSSRIDSILPNADLAAFWELADKVKEKMCRRVPHVSMINYDGAGYLYQDYVMTIKCSCDKHSYEVTRNRSGTIVLGITDGHITAKNYEWIFLERHMRNKLDGTTNG